MLYQKHDRGPKNFHFPAPKPSPDPPPGAARKFLKRKKSILVISNLSVASRRCDNAIKTVSCVCAV